MIVRIPEQRIIRANWRNNMINTLGDHLAATVNPQLADFVAGLLQKPFAIFPPAVGVTTLVCCASLPVCFLLHLLSMGRAVTSPGKLRASRM